MPFTCLVINAVRTKINLQTVNCTQVFPIQCFTEVLFYSKLGLFLDDKPTKGIKIYNTKTYSRQDIHIWIDSICDMNNKTANYHVRIIKHVFFLEG